MPLHSSGDDIIFPSVGWIHTPKDPKDLSLQVPWDEAAKGDFTLHKVSK
jgi:hypothetical protein